MTTLAAIDEPTTTTTPSPTSIQVEATQNPEEKEVLGQQPWVEKLIVVFSGLAGSTKSCQLARMAMMALSCWDMDVYSDFPIGGKIMGKKYEVEPLPDDVFINYGNSLKPGLKKKGVMIVADELQEFFDRQNWQAVSSKMGTSMFMQIRKLQLTVVGAIQFFHYLNPRINDQVDILIRCEDLFFTPWGKAQGVIKGTVARLEYYDLSGAITGKTARSPVHYHLITGDPYKREIVYSKAFWEYFDTHRLTALEQRFRTYRIKKEQREVDQPTQVLERSGKRRQQAELAGFLASIFNDYSDSGIEQVHAADVKKALHADGFTVNDSVLGNAINALGIQRERDGEHKVVYNVKRIEV